MTTEQSIGEVINRPYFRLAFIVVCLLLLGFVAFKEGFSLWILSKLNLNKEHLSPCPPGQIQNIMGMCR